jgi:S-adenosylmethionine synthetase
LPLSFSRTSPSVLYPHLPAPTPLDLLDDQAVRKFFTSLQSDPEKKIDFLIHCAAERRPDVAEADPERAAKLNEASTRLLAELAAELDFGLVYISTDYVFDGKKPPYSSGDAPNPLNLYGRLKRAGEEAVLDIRGKSSDQAKPLVVLRVPLLWVQNSKGTFATSMINTDLQIPRSGMERWSTTEKRLSTCSSIYSRTRVARSTPVSSKTLIVVPSST